MAGKDRGGRRGGPGPGPDTDIRRQSVIRAETFVKEEGKHKASVSNDRDNVEIVRPHIEPVTPAGSADKSTKSKRSRIIKQTNRRHSVANGPTSSQKPESGVVTNSKTDLRERHRSRTKSLRESRPQSRVSDQAPDSESEQKNSESEGEEEDTKTSTTPPESGRQKEQSCSSLVETNKAKREKEEENEKEEVAEEVHSRNTSPAMSDQSPTKMPAADRDGNSGRGKFSSEMPRVFGRQVVTPTSPEPRIKEVHPKSRDPKNKTGTLENIASNFLERVDRTENENRKLLDDNERLLESMKFANEHERQLITQNHSLHSDNADLRERLAKVMEANEELRKKVYDMNLSHSEHKRLLEKERSKLKQEVEDVRESANREKSQLQGQLRGMEELGDAKREELKALQADRRSLQDQVKEVQASKEKLLREVGDRDTNREETLQSMRSELEKLQSHLSRLKKDHEEEKKKNTDLSLQAAQMGKEKLDSLKILDKLREEKNKLQEAQYKAESSQSSLKKDAFKLKNELEAKEKEIKQMNEKLSETKLKANNTKKTHDTLEDLVKEKQSHIDDLRQELFELRTANRSYVKEIERLEKEKTSEVTVTDEKYEEMSSAHKKLLDENKHLRTVIAHKSMAETNNETESTDLKEKLEKTSKKLEAATGRVKKLEQWMDEIYSNEEFQVALRDDVSTTFSTTSLPNITWKAETPRFPVTGRRSVQPGRYVKTKKAF